MAVNDPTTNYGWDLPAPAGDVDAWGQILNEDIADDITALIDSIDTVIFNLDGEVQTLTTRINDLENRILIVEALNQTPRYTRVYLATNVVIPAAQEDTPQTASWTENLDVGGFFSSGTPTRITIPSDGEGIYTFRVQLQIPSWKGSGDDHSKWLLRLRKNGTDTVGQAREPYQNDGWEDDSGTRSLVLECLDNATAADYYEVEFTFDDFEVDTRDLTIIGGLEDSYFEAVRLPSPFVPTTSHMSWTMPVGYYQHITGAEFEPSTTTAHQDQEIYYRPFMVHRVCTIDKAGFRLSSGMSDETNVRIGIYGSDDAVNGRLPKDLIGETGDINLNSSPAGAYEGTFGTPIQLQPGTIYWIAIGHNRVSGIGGFFCNAVQWGGDHYGWHFGNATAAVLGTAGGQGRMKTTAAWGPGMPDPAPTGTYVIEDKAIPAIGVHVSA